MNLFILILCTFVCCYAYEVTKFNKDKVTQLEIPLVRRKSRFHRLLEMGFDSAVVGAMLSKRNPKPKPDFHNDTVQIFKNKDSEYYGSISLGTPGQKVSVVFDTAWGDSVVLSKYCSQECTACRVHSDRYDHFKSSTYVDNNKNFSIPSENMTGFLCEDRLNIGHLNINNQTFAELMWAPDLFLSSNADGIFGMGFKDLAMTATLPFFYNIMNQYINIPHIFSFYLNKDPTTKKGGSLILGAISTHHYDQKNHSINYFPVVSNYYWNVSMSRVYFNHPDESFCERGCFALFDTGASTISVPEDDLVKLNRRILATPITGTNRYEVDCYRKLKLPAITFVFNQTIEFPMKGEHYIQEIQIGNITRCATVFEASSDSNNTWSLGGSFLYHYYSIFDVDKKQVGLVPSL